MDLLPIILLLLLSIGFIFALGIIVFKFSNKNVVSMKVIRGNLFLSIASAIVMVICLKLIGWFSSGVIGILFGIAVSFMYANIFYPIIFPSEVKELSKKEEILRQLSISIAFIILYGILYLVFKDEPQFMTQ